MGTGKTWVAIRWLQDLIAMDCKRILVVAPLTGLSVWRREWEKHSSIPVRFIDWHTRRLAGLVDAQHDGFPTISLVNYESAWRLPLDKVQWDCVVADESHRIKRPSSKQGRYVRKLMTRAPKRLCMTGTPWLESPLDVWAQVDAFGHDTVLPRTFGRFRRRYAIMDMAGGFPMVVGYQNLEELAAKLAKVAYVCKKEECLDLPPAVDEVMLLRLPPKARKAYDDLRWRFITEIEGEKITVLHIFQKITKLAQLTSGFLPEVEDWLHDAKLGALRELCDLRLGRPFVVFCRFLREIEAIRDEFHVPVITGATPPKEREALLREPNARFLVVQEKTGKEAIELTWADLMVFYSMGYSATDHYQAKARVHRIGQTQKVTYVYLAVEDTIDERIISVHQKKLNIDREVTANWRSWFGAE